MLDENLGSSMDLDRQVEMLVKHVSIACDAAVCKKRHNTSRPRPHTGGTKRLAY